MNLEQANEVRKKLMFLEGVFAAKTREYIWKVLIGPEKEHLIEAFKAMIDLTKPIDFRKVVKPFATEELSVYFFLKKEGRIVCRHYKEYLEENDLQVDLDGIIWRYGRHFEDHTLGGA